ncbi:hypothetical protein AB0F20_09515 [Streptomyces goshikiensis]|uniref:hypothetical protein n=1 Tax=Streptomyces goshikiensis TaxID=1942 RepID=UPI0033E21C55
MLSGGHDGVFGRAAARYWVTLGQSATVHVLGIEVHELGQEPCPDARFLLPPPPLADVIAVEDDAQRELRQDAVEQPRLTALGIQAPEAPLPPNTDQTSSPGYRVERGVVLRRGLAHNL